jgi:phospholipid transport system substrate-binding protein
MKTIFLSSLILLLSFCQYSFASTPTEMLKVAVDKLIAVAADKVSDNSDKKDKLRQILSEEVDFEAVSKRVVSKKWKKATEEQKQEFKKRFLTIMTDTYFALLKNYSNEDVLFLKEQLKKTSKNEYAIVDTQIISGNKKIPVRYRLIKMAEAWKIYDFIPEGISLVTTYKSNYAGVLKKNGMQGLLKDMSKPKAEAAKE